MKGLPDRGTSYPALLLELGASLPRSESSVEMNALFTKHFDARRMDQDLALIAARVSKLVWQPEKSIRTATRPCARPRTSRIEAR